MRRRDLLGAVAAWAMLLGMGRPEQLLLMGGASTAPSLDLNFLSGGLDSRIAFTRASIGTYYDSTGTMQTAASGAARFDYGPTPGGTTNWIRNSSMNGAAAGSPGTLPTVGWAESHGAGLTRSIVGTGTEGGIPYVDIRWNGTTADTAGAYINYEVQAGVQVALGQTWTFTGYCRLVGGSVANITAIGSNVIDSNSVPVQVDFAQQLFVPTGAALSTQKFTVTHTIAQATAVYTMPRTFLVMPSGVAIDITLRFGTPQLEQGSTASAWISTTNAAVNVGAVPLGLLIEEARTQSIRNSTAAGAVAGTPGTLPTNWTTGNLGTLSQQVVGTGTENGIAFIDIRFSGTTSTTFAFIQPEQAGHATAAQNQVWALSSYVRLVGGSLTNVTNLQLVINEDNGGFLVSHSVTFTPTSAALATQRQTLASTLTNASTTDVYPTLSVVFSSGVAIDATFRIGLPQLEQGAFATSAIPTSSVAVTRAGDAPSMATAPWYNENAGSIVAEASTPVIPNPSSGVHGLFEFVDTNNTGNRFITRVDNGTSTLKSYWVNASGQPQNSGGAASGALTASSVLKHAMTMTSGSWNLALNGTQYQTGAAGYLPPTITLLRIGFGTFDNQWAGYIRRIRYWPRVLASSELIAATAGDAPALDLDFVNSTTLDPRITFTRASAGTYFDATGVLQSASTNVARYDYGASPGGVTNFILNSASIGSSGIAGLTVGLNAAVAPDGTTTASLLTETTANSQHLVGPQMQRNMVVGDIITLSAYFKAAGSSAPALTMFGEGNGSFDLAAVTAGRTGSCTASTITSVGNGWYRCTATFTKSNSFQGVFLAPAGFGTYVGNVNTSVYAWGWQGEYGVSTAGVYVPTGASVPANSGALPKGLLIEEARTNSIRNNTMVGAVVGTPGTYPTNWNNIQNSGLVPNVIGFGTENGISYIDLQYSGTTAGGTQNQLVFDTGSFAASPSQAWNFSAYIRLVGGSLANVVSINLLAGDNIAPQNGTNIVPTSAALATQRQTFQFTTNAGAVTTLLNKSLIFTFSAAPVAVNLTLRIGLPQIEQGGFATSAIQTSSVAVTRAADVANMSADTSWFSGGLAPGTMGAEYLPEFAGAAASGNVHALTISDAGVANRYCLRSKSSGGPTASSLIVSGGTSAIGSGTLLTDVVGTISKLAIAWSGGAVQNSVGNGGTVQATTAPAPIASLTTVGIANLASGNFSCGWTRRVRYWPRMLPNTELQSVTT